MMLVTSSVMGVPLYRDIEYNTKEYYLSYPITKAGYFWGRFFSSFFLVLVIDAAVLFGAYFGSKLGPVFGWQNASHYGPDRLINYLYPFVTIAIPNLFFTSALFFGLVAATRNVKVIYTSGIFMFLGYMIANFFIGSSSSKALIYLADPFGVNAVKFERGMQTLEEKNNSLMGIHGLFLWNRIIWTSVGLIIILYTYARFNFEKFFSGRKDKKASKEKASKKYNLPTLNIHFGKGYSRKILFTLTKIEVLNIIRDTYFWLIIGGGAAFLCMVFSHGPGQFWVPDFPRTSMILFIFNDNFLFFIFCIIMFYTGETIHREKVTRYAFINDALPPPDLILNFAKVLSILCLALFLTVLPMVIGIVVQAAEGYTQFNLPLYISTLFGITLPKCVEMVMLAFMLHICINNKFAALGVGIALWTLFLLADVSGWFSYHLLLYSYTPNYGISDFDGVGHMIKPISWFNLYWLLFGGLLLVLGYLFYVRGTISSFKERVQLAKERFSAKTRVTTYVLLALFLATAAYNYYNVDYLNAYYTRAENKERAATAEKKLKHFEDMPLPKVTNIKIFADLYPAEQKATFKSYVTLVNKTAIPITQLLLDGDNVTDYSIKYNGADISYTNPLLFKRGKFNFLRVKDDSSSYRLYQLPKALAPGDSAIFEVNSVKEYHGFGNYFYGADLMHNGSFFGDGLPGLGYDDDEELTDEEDRKEYGLPKKEEEFPEDEDSAGTRMLLEGPSSSLIKFDLTISTPESQIALAPGDLEKQWQENGRNYYHYVSNQQGAYTGLGFASARYGVLKDTVNLTNQQPVTIEFYYQPGHDANLQRFMASYKDGLRYFTSVYGPYPFKQMRVVESTEFTANYNSAAALGLFSERFGWNADFTGQWDYIYLTSAQQMARQWWGAQVSPNHTKGSQIIVDGLAKYDALLMMEKKFGKEYMRPLVNQQLDFYLWNRGRIAKDQNPVLRSDKWAEFDIKTGFVLYGLKDLIGEDSVNAALREFYNAYAFRNTPPYAGSKDLYSFIKKHVPDSLQYYLTDTWEKITFYDNKIVAATVTPLGKNNQYKVSIKVNTNKIYQDSNGNDSVASMNDYIDIGVFAADSSKVKGRNNTNLLYLQKHKFTSGEHTIDIIVTGKPVKVAIDPYVRLIDRNIGDNWKDL